MKAKLILFCSLFILSFGSGAQTVTIPDPHFVTWLNATIPSAMSGNQMDTSSIDVKGRLAVYIGSDSIQDLTGIQYFSSLRNLDCSGNRLTYIPALPDSLETFICSGNMLDSLPAFPQLLTLIDCSGNYLDSLPPLPVSLVTLHCNSNHLPVLPALPVTLNTLDCGYNSLAVLPALPDSLFDLNCAGNLLTVLPALPDSLLTLNCFSNQLTALPALPAALTLLECGSNMLSSLPALPASLIELHCYYNQLTALPALPAGLQVLVAGGNLLPVLPVLPASLLTLKCYTNQLPVLPALPGLLQYLDCSSNLLSTLPAMPASLAYVNCSQNQINVLPALTTGLQTLFCRENLLTVLPVLPSSLVELDCSTNPLTDLPVLNTGLVNLSCSNNGLDSIPALPSSLSSLNCSSNMLTVLPALPASLSSLDCNFNQLSALPVLPASLSLLQCSDNQLTALPALPASLMGLNCNTNLINCFTVFPGTISFIAISGNPFTCLPNYIPAMDSLILNYPLCIDGDFVNNPNGCDGAQGILGFTYFDNNSDCAKDSADFNYINIPVKLYDSTGVLISQTYTASNGVYNFSEAAGTYTVAIDTTNVPFIPQCPSPGVDSTVLITAAAPLVSNVNFDFGCKPGFDIGVRSVVPTGWVFPGQQHQLKVIAGDMSQWYNMHCAAGTGGQVKITVDGPVTYNGIVSGAMLPSVSGHDYTYSIADFGTINNNQAFGLLFTTDTTAAAGSSVCVHVVVTPVGGDNDSSNNVNQFCYQVVNSHDPNLKEVYPGDISPKYKDWLTYTIHFQNTGTAPAMNIRVADTLDSNLDLSTFEVLNYSHTNTVSLNGRILTVRFANIMLPDSTSDLAGSQGYIQYRIKPTPYLPIGTHIENTAYIYFDYNDPVVTNTTTNELVNTVSVNENEQEISASIYPNPNNGQFIVK
ncbi:MAG: hypothetical protein JWO44_1412, partial [Bacteroidetes bacterium]|nr:hypothetical protein [Bacteroidota bacterium]